jgi:glycosyl transferase, family 25
MSYGYRSQNLLRRTLVIPIYVISLATDGERRARMKTQLDGVRLPFRFVDGVNGRHLTEQAREQAAPSQLRRYWSNLTGGEIGCALSHLAAIRMIADSPEPFGAVFEDDVLICPEFPQFLAGLERNPPPFDMMWLCQASRKKHRVIMPVGQVADRQIRARVYLDYTAAATIYTREAARRIVGSLKVVVAPIDHMLWYNHSVSGLRVVEAHPYIVKQDISGPSSIGDRRVNAIGPRAKLRREIIRYTNTVRRWRSFVSAWGPAAVLKLRRVGSL